MRQKIIGLIGGMSWESSAEYYRLINQGVRARRGGMHSARCLLWSLDFGEIAAMQHAGRWDDAAAVLIDAARRLQRGGADFIVICTNTMHCVAETVQAAIGLPLLHIADPTAERIVSAGLRTVGLLGTRFTMEQDVYKGRLTERHGLTVLVPDAADRALVHRVIYDELVQGRIEPSSRQAYREVIARLVARGAEAVILGCTELMLLVRPEDSAVPLFDTTALHAEAAVDRSLDDAPEAAGPLSWRRATAPDAAAIRALTRAAYAKWVPLVGREPRPMVADYAEAVRLHRIDLLEDGGALAGLIELVPGAAELLIRNVAVAPGQQGSGHGRRLLDRAEQVAAEMGLPLLTLYTNAKMAENLRLYLARGYTIDRTEQSELGTTVHMSKPVAPVER